MIMRRAPLAIALWIACAFVVWNVVFDRVVVLAGRQYVYRAVAAAGGSKGFERIDAWMPAAVARGAWLASSAAGAILAAGFLALTIAVRRESRAGRRATVRPAKPRP